MNDYARIAKVIRYLDSSHRHQPDLATAARILGLSPFHFHRLFKHWAGVTPKAFIQCLTLQEAKRALLKGHSVLDAALDAGLSGPGRLHDLCVKLDAATPGEIKSRGESLHICYGFGTTPFGRCLVAHSRRGLCYLAFLDSGQDETQALAKLKDTWTKAQMQRDDEQAADLLGRVFRLERPLADGNPPLTAWAAGTAFQIRVWRALLELPPGHLTSYGHLAKSIGHPGAARAVGTAIGANPMAFLIPCHRVIRETGIIGHYRWGHGRKRALIAWERALGEPRS